jgi:hypothetical protein
MSSYTNTNFSNPITKAGRVVYNVNLDMDEAYRRRRRGDTYQAVDNIEPHVDDETLTVLPHEILLQRNPRHTKRKMTPSSVNDTQIFVLSALNGLQANNGTKPKKAMESMRFAGIAATAAPYSTSQRVQNNQIFVAQVGGLCTIQNTGTDPIYSGEYVVWDFPHHIEEGKNMCGKKDKQMVITRPYTPKFTDPRALKRKYEDKSSRSATGSFLDIYKFIKEDEDEVKGRIIGRAMSDAKEGEVFDLLLGRYSA